MIHDCIGVILMMNFWAIAMACAFAAERTSGPIWGALAFGFMAGGTVLSWGIATAIVGKP